MNTDQEIRSMCWYQQSCVDEINRFVDKHVVNQPPQEHISSFVELLKLCEGKNLLDIGSGAGMLRHHCAPFTYHGCDLPHIVIGCGIRNNPDQFFRVCNIMEDELAWIKKFDVLVLNALIDVMHNGLGVLRRIITYATGYVIIHRQEITENGHSRSVVNGSYGGRTYHSIINRNDFNALIEEMGLEIVKEVKLNFGNWENGGSSFLLRSKELDVSRYSSNPLRQLKNRIQQTSNIKVVLGASDQVHDLTWIATNIEELDAEREKDWEFLFDERKICNVFCEHVWEHIGNPKQAAKNIFKHLDTGGILRIAVPDGLHPDPKYIEHVKVGGTGAGADDHRFLYTYESLGQLLQEIGFHITLVEWWDKDGFFHSAPQCYNPSIGLVNRSFKLDERNKRGVPAYTSLIIDAIKP